MTLQTYHIEVRALTALRPSEEVKPLAVSTLKAKIFAAQHWTSPISIEAASGIIMDGNHRWHAAMQLGLTHVPCIALSYQDSRVKVRQWHSDTPFDIGLIFETVLGGKVLPYKTTRHIFVPQLPDIAINLEHLRQPHYN